MPKSKPTRHLEVERKFDVADSAVSPSFSGIAGLTRVDDAPVRSLDAVYYDTAARDLAANRITLRRRQGGPDAGWHLKLPAGTDARTELRLPPGADHNTVPAELVDVVAAIVRGRPLVPVARISTVRGVQLLYGADETVLAEFCDDRVTAAAAGAAPQCWREWELELVTGDAGLLDRLGNRLRDAGARPGKYPAKLARVLPAPQRRTRPADPLHRAVAQQLDALLVWDRAVRADADDAVHQMRVTTRKIRSLLQAGGMSDDEWLLDELRQLAGVLGTARDAEVLADRYRRALAGLSKDLVRGRVADRLVDGADRRYQAGLRRSLTAMRSPRYFRLLDALDALVAEPPGTPAGTPVPLRAAYRRVRKAAKAAARAAGEPGRDEALHRIRKGAKRLRYTAAAAKATKVADAAKAVQALLGDHQDSVVSRKHLIQQADAAHAAGEDTFTYGLLYQQESDLAHACRAQLDTALRRLTRAMRKRGRVGL